MNTYFDSPTLGCKERQNVASALGCYGFNVAPPDIPLDARFYYYARLVGAKTEYNDLAALSRLGLTIVTIGVFNDHLPRHLSANGPVFIDIRSWRIVSRLLVSYKT